MRQGLFVKINEKKWKDFETKLKDLKSTSADEISSIYVHLTEDLAFSQANYPNTRLTQYLNELTVKVHGTIYRNKPEHSSRFYRFWRHEVPRELNSSYRYIGYAFLVLAVGALMGALSAANDETFIRLILGDGYVDMTLENIKNGDPMGVYGSMPESYMFFVITANNIKVSLMAFAAGILFSVGTGYILFTNGVMLGAFQYFFYQQGYLADSISVWVHGTLEITAIIIAGAAGFVMGHGILFPGTYPRRYSFQKSAKKGLKIVISLIPFFIVAGFIESFFTRHTEWPLAIKLFIIFISLFVIVTYLVILPLINRHDRQKN